MKLTVSPQLGLVHHEQPDGIISQEGQQGVSQAL
jgi:hypothetical protein